MVYADHDCSRQAETTVYSYTVQRSMHTLDDRYITVTWRTCRSRDNVHILFLFPKFQRSTIGYISNICASHRIQLMWLKH